MKQTLYSILFTISLILTVSCGNSAYDIAEQKPTLEIGLLQDTYTVDEPVFIQLRASQKGYEGAYQLSIVQNAGACECSINGEVVPLTGEWVTLKNHSEILTVTPRQIGPLRLSFEVKTSESTLSGRSSISLNVQPSEALHLSFTYPSTSPISSPVEIAMTVAKAGFSGMIAVKFEQTTGSGSLQFGALVVKPGESFTVPANGAQTLYYTATERGTHTLQFSATDSYTTDFQSIEIIVTK